MGKERARQDALAAAELSRATGGRDGVERERGEGGRGQGEDGDGDGDGRAVAQTAAAAAGNRTRWCWAVAAVRRGTTRAVAMAMAAAGEASQATARAGFVLLAVVVSVRSGWDPAASCGSGLRSPRASSPRRVRAPTKQASWGGPLDRTETAGAGGNETRTRTRRERDDNETTTTVRRERERDDNGRGTRLQRKRSAQRSHTTSQATSHKPRRAWPWPGCAACFGASHSRQAASRPASSSCLRQGGCYHDVGGCRWGVPTPAHRVSEL